MKSDRQIMSHWYLVPLEISAHCKAQVDSQGYSFISGGVYDDPRKASIFIYRHNCLVSQESRNFRHWLEIEIHLSGGVVIHCLREYCCWWIE